MMEASMRRDVDICRAAASQRSAICGGNFGLDRHHSWRTAMCSKRCMDLSNSATRATADGWGSLDPLERRCLAPSTEFKDSTAHDKPKRRVSTFWDAPDAGVEPLEDEGVEQRSERRGRDMHVCDASLFFGGSCQVRNCREWRTDDAKSSIRDPVSLGSWRRRG